MIPSIKTHIVTRFTVSSCLYKKIPKITPEIMLFRVKPGKNGPLGLTIYWIMSEIPPTTPPTRGPYSIPVKAKAKKLKDISIMFENTILKKSIITATAISKAEPVIVLISLRLSDFKLIVFFNKYSPLILVILM